MLIDDCMNTEKSNSLRRLESSIEIEFTHVRK